jgi:DNA polymerase-3 subunit epsilon
MIETTQLVGGRTSLHETATALAGVLGRRIRETPIAVIDFETTGMNPGVDRVVEAAVVRIDPGEAPRLAFDSLFNPGRPMACTEIHGIAEQDVRDAPTFADVAGEFAAALEGCVVAAYNVAFDSRFLHFEMANAGIRHRPPHLCLMYLRPLLGIGVRCRLEYACRIHRIDYRHGHVAAGDAFSAAGLMQPCLEAMTSRGIGTFGDLASLGRYRFLESFICQPYPDIDRFGLRRGGSVKSRASSLDFTASNISAQAIGAASPEQRPASPQTRADYWDLLDRVASDPNLSDAELSSIREERSRSGLKADQIRAMHARLFAGVIHSLVETGTLDRSGVELLRRTRERLKTLGWAPGD